MNVRMLCARVHTHTHTHMCVCVCVCEYIVYVTKEFIFEGIWKEAKTTLQQRESRRKKGQLWSQLPPHDEMEISFLCIQLMNHTAVNYASAYQTFFIY